MLPLFCINPEKPLFFINLKTIQKATLTPDPNINTGSETIIPDVDSTSHQTVPKI